LPGSDAPSDQELVQAANQGDVSAFETLYLRHRDWVVRLAYRFTGQRDDALDVLQETFTYLLKKLPRLRLSASMTTFLYPVVRNLSLALVRRRKRYVLSEEVLRELAALGAEAAGASRAELANALAALPEAQREVLLLCYVDGMTLREIAQALKLPLGTVKSRLHNALNRLRRDGRTRRYFLE